MKLFFLILSFFLIVPAPAQAQYIIKDSIYFMLDDGKQSPEEMVEESEYLHQWCLNNGYQSSWFNCDCLAGAFLNEREARGPNVPQYDIMEELTKSRKAVCPNTENIAGMIYRDCMAYAEISRELETDNEDYCTCAANKTARDFSTMPRLNIRYIRNVRSTALVYCNDPRNRPSQLSNTNSTIPSP